MTSLQKLDLSSNKIAFIPPWIIDLKKFEAIKFKRQQKYIYFFPKGFSALPVEDLRVLNTSIPHHKFLKNRKKVLGSGFNS
jgi:hypothetical protein